MSDKSDRLNQWIAIGSIIVAGLSLVISIWIQYSNNKTQITIKEYEINHTNRINYITQIYTILQDYAFIRQSLFNKLNLPSSDISLNYIDSLNKKLESKSEKYLRVQKNLKSSDSLLGLLKIKVREFESIAVLFTTLLDTVTTHEFLSKTDTMAMNYEQLNGMLDAKLKIIQINQNLNMYLVKGKILKKDYKPINDTIDITIPFNNYKNQAAIYRSYLRKFFVPKISSLKE